LRFVDKMVKGWCVLNNNCDDAEYCITPSGGFPSAGRTAELVKSGDGAEKLYGGWMQIMHLERERVANETIEVVSLLVSLLSGPVELQASSDSLVKAIDARASEIAIGKASSLIADLLGKRSF